MPLIVRVDVDRAYGISTLRHRIISKIGSDFYFPVIERLGYLRDLKAILRLLSEYQVRAHVFFRRSTLPTDSVLHVLEDGHHIAGLHLENSLSFETFREELLHLESHLGFHITEFSKHGSGRRRYGLHHFIPYEPEKYLDWGRAVGMRLFFGNLEDPTMPAYVYQTTLRVFPAMYWLEPEYRNTRLYTSTWLLCEIEKRDVTLAIHPDDIIASDELMKELCYILQRVRQITT